MYLFHNVTLFDLISGAEVSDCGRYVILTPTEGCDPTNRLFYVDIQTLPDGINGILPYVKVVDNFDAQYEVSVALFITISSVFILVAWNFWNVSLGIRLTLLTKF